MEFFWKIFWKIADLFKEAFDSSTYGFNKSQKTIVFLLIVSQVLFLALAEKDSLKDGVILFSFILVIGFFIYSRRTIRQYEKSLKELDEKLKVFVDKKTQELQTSFNGIRRDIKTIEEQYQVLLRKYKNMDQLYLEKHEKYLTMINALVQKNLDKFEELIRDESGAILTEARRILENPKLDANSQLNLLRDKSRKKDEEGGGEDASTY